MLESLKIRNFEAHRNSTLNFHPGVNVIIGESDQGKSAILRALEWVLFNRPTGEDIKSNWLDSPNTFAEVMMDDISLKRKRTKKFNGYVFDNAEFKAFKRQIPEEIASFINMNDINILSQEDPLFMINWTPGERGRYINDICDMKIIDTTTTHINQTVRYEISTIKHLEKNIQESETSLKEFDPLEQMEAQLKKIEESSELLKKIESKIDLLDETTQKYKDLTNRGKKFKGFLKNKEQLHVLSKKVAQISSKTAKISSLSDKIEKWHEKNKQFKVVRNHNRNYHKRFHKLMPDKCPLCGK